MCEFLQFQPQLRFFAEIKLYLHFNLTIFTDMDWSKPFILNLKHLIIDPRSHAPLTISTCSLTCQNTKFAQFINYATYFVFCQTYCLRLLRNRNLWILAYVFNNSCHYTGLSAINTVYL